jgi:GT2 family glycosyltransferase
MLFTDIGLFDEQLFLSWEDVDLDLRAALAGHRCLYVPSAIVHHAQGASSGEWRAELERRNKAILALKGLPLPLLALYLTLLPAREAYETRAAREGVAGYLRRLKPYATEAPRALRRRGEVRRRTGLRELWPLLTRDSLPYEP